MNNERKNIKKIIPKIIDFKLVDSIHFEKKIICENMQSNELSIQSLKVKDCLFWRLM